MIRLVDAGRQDDEGPPSFSHRRRLAAGPRRWPNALHAGDQRGSGSTGGWSARTSSAIPRSSLRKMRSDRPSERLASGRLR